MVSCDVTCDAGRLARVDQPKRERPYEASPQVSEQFSGACAAIPRICSVVLHGVQDDRRSFVQQAARMCYQF